MRTADGIVAALALPQDLSPSEGAPRLPIPELHRLPRDGSMLYGIGRADTSGRVADHAIVEALGWRCGDKLEIATTSRALVIWESPNGVFYMPRRPCIVIPASARRYYGIKPGDNIFLAAAPEYGMVIVQTMSALDGMLADYLAQNSPAAG